MGLRDRDYMQDEGGEDRGRRYDDEAREAQYGGFLSKRQKQNRKLIIVFLIVIAVILLLAILTSKKMNPVSTQSSIRLRLVSCRFAQFNIWKPRRQTLNLGSSS